MSTNYLSVYIYVYKFILYYKYNLYSFTCKYNYFYLSLVKTIVFHLLPSTCYLLLSHWSSPHCCFKIVALRFSLRSSSSSILYTVEVGLVPYTSLDMGIQIRINQIEHFIFVDTVTHSEMGVGHIKSQKGQGLTILQHVLNSWSRGDLTLTRAGSLAFYQSTTWTQLK